MRACWKRETTFFFVQVLLLLGGASVLWSNPASATTSAPFQACGNALTEHVSPRESARCFYEAAQATSLWQEAADRLTRHLAEEPGNHWLRLYLAHTVRNLPGDRSREAEALYRDAIAGFLEARESHGELLARKGLRNFLARRSRHEEAARQYERILALYKSSPDLKDQLRKQILEAGHLFDAKTDLGRALRMLQEIRFDLPKLIREGSVKGLEGLQLKTLLLLGALSMELGQLDQAEEYLQEAAAVEQRHKDVLARSSIHMNLALISLSRHDRHPSEPLRRTIVENVHRWVETAEAAGHREAAAVAHLELGKLLGFPEGIEHLERCVGIAREDQDPVLQSECLLSLAILVSPVDPDTATEFRSEALKLAHRTGEARTIASIHASASMVSWEISDPATATKTSLQALDRIEHLRGMQTGEEGRLGLFSEWVPHYQRFVGYLLKAYQGSEKPRFLEQAFQVNERMRSRVLQEALDLAGHEQETGIPLEHREALKSLEAKMSRVNRRLLEDELSPERREQYERTLERLELQWDGIRHEILAVQRQSWVAPETPSRSLRQVQETLGPREALVTFQVAPEQDIYRNFFGGSWALAVTRDHAVVEALGDGTFLPKKIEFLLGLLENREPTLEHRALQALYANLLQGVVQKLPRDVERLILVPDGALHSLPFTALRMDDGRALGKRFQITRIPSATLWLRWRNRPVEPSPFPALVLTDPQLDAEPASEAATAETRGGEPALVHRNRLGQLPLAREEGRDLVRHLGRKTLLREGAEATESLIQELDLKAYQVLHFAAHAKADASHPERSAIYLARSDESRDGLLQFREIVDLDLDGRIVVLSACDTATGEILRGEGVLDLARAFFQAGAHAVVASLWPLRDDDGRDFFDAFYRHLAEGESLAGALQGAQIDRIDAGAPAAAWAGIVVLGDGSMVPFPEAKLRLPFSVALLMACGIFFLAAVFATASAKK